jgi:hypothetical protein
MRWFLSQVRATVKSLWWLLILAFLAFYLVNAFSGAATLFSLGLVIMTGLLVVVSARLAGANQSVADHEAREEIRGAMGAAKHFIEIDPDAFLDVLKGGRAHPFFDAIDDLASHGNNLHDRDTVRDLYNIAGEVDNVKIRNTTMRDPKATLVKLQGRVINELMRLRLDLRDWSKG